jgi:hypothetical protein
MGGRNGHQVSSWCLRFLGKTFLFYVCNVFHNMIKESMIERLQRITKEEKAHKVAK